MDARKTAWDRLMTYRFEDADSDRLSMETIDALTYARDMLATQQARIDELEKASNTAVADYKRWVLPQYGAVDGLDELAALLQESTK